MSSIRRSLAAFVALGAATASADTVTTVAVLEVGKAGAVRRVTSSSVETDAMGISSLWESLHGRADGRRLTSRTPGMSVVADLFHKPTAGVAIALLGSDEIDLSAMPGVTGLLAGDETIGKIDVTGSMGRNLLERAPTTNLEAMEIPVDVLGATAADAKITAIINELKERASSTGETTVIHLIVEQPRSAESIELQRRRLEDAQDDGNNGNNNNANNQNDGFYGYGYYNDNNEWVQVSKSIFQIQYFQVVLWTAIGLAVALIYVIYLMVGMPLMADTLLFGESAKMMGAD